MEIFCHCRWTCQNKSTTVFLLECVFVLEFVLKGCTAPLLWNVLNLKFAGFLSAVLCNFRSVPSIYPVKLSAHVESASSEDQFRDQQVDQRGTHTGCHLIIYMEGEGIRSFSNFLSCSLFCCRSWKITFKWLVSYFKCEHSTVTFKLVASKTVGSNATVTLMVSVCRILQHICGAGLKPALPFSLVKLSGRFRIDTFEWTSKSAKSTKLKPKAKRSTGLIRSWNLCWRCSCTLGTIFPCTLYRTPFPLTVLRLTVLCQVGFSSYRCVLVRRVFERLHKRILRWIDVQAKRLAFLAKPSSCPKVNVQDI